MAHTSRYEWDFGCHFVCLPHSVRLQFNANGILAIKLNYNIFYNIITCSFSHKHSARTHHNQIHWTAATTLPSVWVHFHRSNGILTVLNRCAYETNVTFCLTWRPTGAHKLNQPRESRNRQNCFLSISCRFQAAIEMKELSTKKNMRSESLYDHSKTATKRSSLELPKMQMARGERVAHVFIKSK